jgi:hypothetical protein
MLDRCVARQARALLSERVRRSLMIRIAIAQKQRVTL